MHPTPIAWRSQACQFSTPRREPRTVAADPAYRPGAASSAPVAIAAAKQADILKVRPAEPSAPPPRIPAKRANLWTLAQDLGRELAASLRDAYVISRREGIIEAVRMLTSHASQVGLGTMAFVILNLGRRLHAIWQWMRGVPVRSRG